MKKILVSLLLSAGLVSASHASNVTSVSVAADFFASVTGLQITDVTTTATPSLGYTFGFSIDLGSTYPGPGGLGGYLTHTGSSLTVNDALTLSDFAIGYDVSRSFLNNSGFYLKSTTPGLILFDIQLFNLQFDGETLTLGPGLLNVSSELASFIEKPHAAGSFAGMIQSNAQFFDGAVIPEPGTYALLLGLAGLGFVLLRRRKA